MDGQFPVLDERGILIQNFGGLPAAHPCGFCPEWSIYVVCWRSGGCGVAPCVEDVYLSLKNSTYLNRGGCGIHKFIYTTTKIGQIRFGPVVSPLTGTVSVEFTLDGVSIRSPASQDVFQTVEAFDFLTMPTEAVSEYLSEGWHSFKAFVTWEGTVEGVGETTIREMYAACVYAAIRPSGENELQKLDVVILPGSGNEICISETLGAAKMLGPYRSYDDANFVRQTWASIIDAYAEYCFCANPCHGDGTGGISSAIDDEVEPMEGTSSQYDMTALMQSVGHGEQSWLGCGPSDYPLYVDLWWGVADWTTDGNSGLELNGVYLRFYEADGTEIQESEIEVTDGYEGTLVIPACQFVRVVVSISNRPQQYEWLEVTLNASSTYSAYEDYSDPQDCPFMVGDQVQNIEDMVPYNADSLLAWLQEQGET